MLLSGVYVAKKANGEIYYRASFTYKNKHISLGSYSNEDDANSAYIEAKSLIESSLSIDDYGLQKRFLSFEKWVCIVNYRDNNIYFKTPIYMKPKHFEYHYDPEITYKFDVDDLFYFSTHKIMKRGKHLFVSDYGMQISILSRYGIKKYAVEGRDYIFKNGDNTDLRYENIEIINKYTGVVKNTYKGRSLFTASIHINGNIIIGRYKSEVNAAIAYNKAVDILHSRGLSKNFDKNYIEDLSNIEYAKKYNMLSISRKIREFTHP